MHMHMCMHIHMFTCYMLFGEVTHVTYMCMCMCMCMCMLFGEVS